MKRFLIGLAVILAINLSVALVWMVKSGGDSIPSGEAVAAEDPEDQNEVSDHAVSDVDSTVQTETAQDVMLENLSATTVSEEYPSDWDADDPLNARAYEQMEEYEDDETQPVALQAESLSTALSAINLSTSGFTSTKWGSSTFYHSTSNTSGKSIVAGIDVSYHQDDINWTKVKAAGISYAIIRVGYRGSASGTLNLDTKFKENIVNAQKAGLKVGVYFFSQAITTSEAKAEANYVLDHVKGYGFEMPVIFDYEYYSGGRLAKAGLSKSKKTSIAEAFCTTIRNAGYDSMVYASSNWFYSQLDASSLAKNSQIWMARYNSYSYNSSKDSGKSLYSGKINMWQSSSSAAVKGISGYVDLDYWYKPSGWISGNSVMKVKVSSQEKTSLTLKWNSVSIADKYQLYYSTSRNGTYKKVATTSSGTTSYTMKGLSSGTEYYFRVRYYTKLTDGSLKYSSYSSKTAAATLNSSVRHIKTKTAVSLRKYAGTENSVLCSIPKSKIMALITKTKSKAGDTWYKVSYTKSGKTYTGYVIASAVSYAVPQATGMKTADRTRSALCISWKKVSGASGYLIYRSSSRDGSFSCIGKVSSGSTVKYTNRSLSSRTAYYYNIKAYQAIGSKTYYASCSSVHTAYTEASGTLKVKTTASLNLRSYAGTYYKRIAGISKSTVLTVSYKTKDKYGNSWYKVSYKSGTKTYSGFVQAKYTKKA